MKLTKELRKQILIGVLSNKEGQLFKLERSIILMNYDLWNHGARALMPKDFLRFNKKYPDALSRTAALYVNLPGGNLLTITAGLPSLRATTNLAGKLDLYTYGKLDTRHDPVKKNYSDFILLRRKGNPYFDPDDFDGFKKLLQELVDLHHEWEEVFANNLLKIWTALGNAKSEDDLIRIWPEVKDFIPKAAAKVYLPAPIMTDVNKTFGLAA
jgi:hypothetical protein